MHCHVRDGFDLYRSSDIVFKEYVSVQSLVDMVADGKLFAGLLSWVVESGDDCGTPRPHQIKMRLLSS